MVPKLADEIELWIVEQMILSGWFIRESIVGTVSYVKRHPSGGVLIRMQTKDGLEYECLRPSRPTAEVLFASPWRRVSNVVSVCPADPGKAVLLESVLVYNEYQTLLEQHNDTTPYGGLGYPGQFFRAGIPAAGTCHCATHHRYYYAHTDCPLCLLDDDVDVEPARILKQVAA